MRILNPWQREDEGGRGVACPNTECPKHGMVNAGNVTGAGSFRTKRGRSQRYACDACDSTFCRNTGTPYHRLHASRNAFDTVAKMAVEGVGASAIGRVAGKAWTTIERWTQKAQAAALLHSPRAARPSPSPP